MHNEEHHLAKWKPNLSEIVDRNTPAAIGNKKNEKPRFRRKENSERDTSYYCDGRLSIDDDDKFHLVYVSLTKSVKCYGCKERDCATEKSPLPPTPWDMVLGRKLFRAFSPKGKIGIRISKSKEAAYFHLKKECVNVYFEVRREDIVVDELRAPPKKFH